MIFVKNNYITGDSISQEKYKVVLLEGMILEKGRKTDFAKNTAIMTAASIVMKLIGLYLNIFLARDLGAEGMGLYSLVMSVYFLASGISVSGMSVAVTRISSQELASGSESTCRGTLKYCMFVSGALALLSGIIMVCLSSPISEHWLKDKNTAKSLCVIAFALLPVSISAMLRGWYTARRKILMPAVSQLFEQIVRLASCVTLVKTVAEDAQSGCFALVLSDVTAEYAGCALLFVFFIIIEKRESSEPHNIGRRTADHAVPITFSHYLTATLRTVESTLIPACLVTYGMSRSDALSSLGIIHSMAVPLLFFPAAVLSSAGSLLIPEIVRYNALGQRMEVRKTTEKAVGMTVCCGVPVGAVFLMFAKEWGVMFYNEERLGAVLSVLAPLVPLMYSETICTAILRGLGEQKSLLRYNTIDGVLRLVLIIITVPKFGVSGILGTMIASNIFTPVMCLVRLNRITGAKDYFGMVLKSIVGALCGAGIVYVSRKALSGIPDKAGAVIFSAVFVLVYGLAILCSTQKLKEAAHRACLQIPKEVRCISCRQVRADTQAARHAHRSR